MHITLFSSPTAVSTHSDIFHLIKLHVMEPLENVINLSFGKAIYYHSPRVLCVFSVSLIPCDFNLQIGPLCQALSKAFDISKIHLLYQLSDLHPSFYEFHGLLMEVDSHTTPLITPHWQRFVMPFPMKYKIYYNTFKKML